MTECNVRNYSIVRYISKGGFGQVFAAKDEITGKEVAVKRCQKCLPTAMEITLLRLLDHENILKLFEVQVNDGLVYLILEFCDILDLKHIIFRHDFLPEGYVQEIFQQLGLAMRCLRANNVVHMDIKPANILLHSAPEKERFIVKLADFGLSQILLPGETGSKNIGSILYTAPEVHLDKPYDASVDLWSLGIVLYESLFGLRPFSTCEKIVKYYENPCQIRIPTSNKISDICKDILFGLLKANPKQRISFHDFVNHEFLKLSNLNPDSFRPRLHGDAKNFSIFLASMFEATNGFKITFQETKLMRLSMFTLQVSSLDINSTGLEGEKRIVNDMFTAFKYKPDEVEKLFLMRFVFPTLKSYPSCLDILLVTREKFDEALQCAIRAENLASVNMFSPAVQLYEYALNLMTESLTRETSKGARSLFKKEVQKWKRKYEIVKCMIKPC